MEILTQTPVGIAVAIFEGTDSQRATAKASFTIMAAITELQGGAK